MLASGSAYTRTEGNGNDPATIPADSPPLGHRQPRMHIGQTKGGKEDIMSTAGKLIGLAFVSIWLVACADDGLGPRSTTPDLEAGLAFSQAGEPADVSGTWAVAGVLQLIVPDWVAEFVIGIDPEGPRTHIRCTFSGTAELVQNGNTFTGTEMQDPNQCVTRGGQVFQGEGGPVPIVDGRIHGRNISFVLDDFPVFCPQQGVISDIENGSANRMSGTGRCIIPGHPKSEALDLPPPPLGVSKALSWEYSRL
jgi:hypothetical protein